MNGRWMVTALALLAALVPLAAAAVYPRQLTDARLVELADRDVLILRANDVMPTVNAYQRDQESLALSFLLSRVGHDELAAPGGATSLISGVAFSDVDVSGTTVVVRLASDELLDHDFFRFSQPSRGIVMLEVFPAAGGKQSAGILTDVDSLVPAAPSVPAPAPPAAAPAAETAAFDPDALGIATVDLREADPARVLGLAAASGLLDLEGTARVATEHWGELSVRPAGQSVVSWTGQSPPGELFLAGEQEQLASFLALADSAQLDYQPTIEYYWITSQSEGRHAPTLGGGTSVATRQRVKDDPFAGLYYASTMPSGGRLSDIRVSLPAMSGMNLLDVLNYLSLISGISLIIDPYTFEEPFGGSRPPLVPDEPDSGGDQPGFRPAGIFDPQTPRSGGTVIGNFDNVPFDTALELILGVHGLKYVVYNAGGAGGSGDRYGHPGGGEPYQKPTILITSRERLEQELLGQNTISLHQMHYADPYLMTDLLGEFDMLPGTDTGWFIYEGGFGGVGGGTGGGTGGGSGDGGRGTSRAPVPDLLVYRGSTRQPVHDAVLDAVESGADVIRVLLPAEQDGRYVTAFAR